MDYVKEVEVFKDNIEDMKEWLLFPLLIFSTCIWVEQITVLYNLHEVCSLAASDGTVSAVGRKVLCFNLIISFTETRKDEIVIFIYQV
jgi:hypothetical protein